MIAAAITRTPNAAKAALLVLRPALQLLPELCTLDPNLLNTWYCCGPRNLVKGSSSWASALRTAAYVSSRLFMDSAFRKVSRSCRCPLGQSSAEPQLADCTS